MPTIKIKNADIVLDLVGQSPDFPKYTSQIMNLANQNAQGTRPRVVGQLSDLIQEFPGKSFEDWKLWYQEKYPEAINNATDKVISMINNLKEAILLIDKDMIESWVSDLVLSKTFTGLKFQPTILKKLAEINQTEYRLAKRLCKYLLSTSNNNFRHLHFVFPY